MINATYATFNSTPKRLNCVHMGVTSNVLLSTMLDNFMPISQLGNKIIARQFICKDHTVSFNMLPNHRQKCSAFNIWDYLSDCLTLSLGQSYYRSFSRCSTPTLPRMFTSHVGLVNFNFSSKWIDSLIHKLANLFKYSPRCLIGNTKFPFKLFSRDTCLSRSHNKNSVKPRSKWSITLMEDSPRGWRNTSTTEFACIEFAISSLVMLCYLPTFITIYTFWESRLKKEIEARIIIRKLLVEIFYSIGFHIFSPISVYTYTIAQNLRNVKG